MQVLAMIGDQLDYGDTVCGAVLSIRFGEDILSVWNRNASDNQVQNLVWRWGWLQSQSPWLSSGITQCQKSIVIINHCVCSLSGWAGNMLTTSVVTNCRLWCRYATPSKGICIFQSAISWNTSHMMPHYGTILPSETRGWGAEADTFRRELI